MVKLEGTGEGGGGSTRNQTAEKHLQTPKKTSHTNDHTPRQQQITRQKRHKQKRAFVETKYTSRTPNPLPGAFKVWARSQRHPRGFSEGRRNPPARNRRDAAPRDPSRVTHDTDVCCLECGCCCFGIRCRGGTEQLGVKDFRFKIGSSRFQNLGLTGLFVPPLNQRPTAPRDPSGVNLKTRSLLRLPNCIFLEFWPYLGLLKGFSSKTKA